jgi:hypothetical protein
LNHAYLIVYPKKTVSVELILNLAWLGISLAILTAGCLHVARAHQGWGQGATVIALVCLICLLFPVISATDDLNNAGPAMLETSKLKRLLPSLQMAVALLPWLIVQPPLEDKWLALSQPAPLLRLQEFFAFELHRRPPPRSRVA